MWKQLRMPTEATFMASVFLMSSSMAKSAAILPKPSFASTRAVVGLSLTIWGCALGSSPPSRTFLT